MATGSLLIPADNRLYQNIRHTLHPDTEICVKTVKELWEVSARK
jgi:hypothetical protein